MLARRRLGHVGQLGQLPRGVLAGDDQPQHRSSPRVGDGFDSVFHAIDISKPAYKLQRMRSPSTDVTDFAAPLQRR